ncbi:protein MOR1-like [Salvia hispanica]|uniref:protein MOR1-like n=1 Tax=Salvia hispanica TaxID=49212 RepID=UPI002008F8F3|nr:protein MOR1-like [Salvia hispanica]
MKLVSEQVKEPEPEAVPKAVGSVPTEESVADDIFPISTSPQEIDKYDLIDPVDILKTLEKSGFWEAVNASKSCERKVAELTEHASTKKLLHEIFSEVCRTYWRSIWSSKRVSTWK